MSHLQLEAVQISRLWEQRSTRLLLYHHVSQPLGQVRHVAAKRVKLRDGLRHAEPADKRVYGRGGVISTTTAEQLLCEQRRPLLIEAL